jgi:hypothetical protein
LVEHGQAAKVETPAMSMLQASALVGNYNMMGKSACKSVMDCQLMVPILFQNQDNQSSSVKAGGAYKFAAVIEICN